MALLRFALVLMVAMSGSAWANHGGEAGHQGGGGALMGGILGHEEHGAEACYDQHATLGAQVLRNEEWKQVDARRAQATPDSLIQLDPRMSARIAPAHTHLEMVEGRILQSNAPALPPLSAVLGAH